MYYLKKKGQVSKQHVPFKTQRNITKWFQIKEQERHNN
jgi:hypothetical protein